MFVVEKFEINNNQRWFCVGELAGHFDALQRLLNKVDFQPSTDRLILPGNFVGMTPTSRAAPAWLAKHWVKAVMGENEIALMAQLRGERRPALVGQWLRKMSVEQRSVLLGQLEAMPMALELSRAGAVSVVSHRHIPSGSSWSELTEKMSQDISHGEAIERFGTRLDGLRLSGFMGKLEHHSISDICLGISSLVVEKPSRIYSRNGNRCVLLSSALLNQGRRFDCPALLPFVELNSLIEQKLETSQCQGQLDTLSKS